MGRVTVLPQALGIGLQRQSQRFASQGFNHSWVSAVIKKVVEWSFHSTSIHGWSRPRLCRVLYPETGGNAGTAEFTRHSPELGIVAQGMGRYRFGQMRGDPCLVADAPDRCLCDGALGLASRKEPGPGPVAFPIEPQR